MIFVTIGTHPGQFTRLIKKIDSIAPKIKEKIIIQRGFTKYKPKNAESFEFADSLDPYFKKARLVVCHSATSVMEFTLNNKKPLITVPRQKKFGEHINDHQVEFAEALNQKTGILAIYDINDLTPELLTNHNTLPKIKKDNLKNLQNYFINVFKALSNEKQRRR